MKLIVGLGNPGVRYQNTRHNAGFMVVDALADKAGVSVDKDKYEGKIAKFKAKGEDVLLLKPETFMNASGFSLRQAMDFYKLSPQDVLVIYDDMDTPVGGIRLRPQGSAGGHNGMKSVISAMLTDKFSRIRVGIGRDPRYEKIADYVLSKFRPEEKEDLDKAIALAADAAWEWIDHDFSTVMNKYNHKPKKPKNVLKKPEEKPAEENHEQSNS